MKKYIFVLSAVLSLVSLTMRAQDATRLLDKAAATMKAAGDVKIGFTVDAEGTSSVGYIKLQGQKFVVNTGGTITWFDGKTMWNYVKKNEEVNVTTPTAAEIAKMNPYAFLSFYKKGYTASKGKCTSKEQEVLLTGKEGSTYRNVVLRINSHNYQPTYVKLTSSKGNVTELTCNSIMKNQKYTDATFRFNQKNYPKAEIIDLR